MLFLLLFMACSPAAAQPAHAEEGASDVTEAPADRSPVYAARPPTVPAYFALVDDISGFYFYANGGFHADWYVGYNNSWIVKLPPIPSGAYAKAYIGAKLGRAKIKSWPLGWDKTSIPGKIYMAVNQEPRFGSKNMFFLADAADIPLEPLPNDSLENVDSAKWFWAEIPLSRVSAEMPNYLALWSSSRYITDASSSPIVAAAPSDDGEENVWLNRAIRGNPPSGDDVLETPISGIKPALAFKLVPANSYKVLIRGFMGSVHGDDITISFAAIGEDIRAAWLELSYDKFDWQRVGPYMFRAPYFRTLRRAEFSKDMFYLRAAAVDGLENIGHSKEIIIPAVRETPRSALPPSGE